MSGGLYSTSWLKARSVTRLRTAFSSHIFKTFRDHITPLVNLFPWLTVLRMKKFFLYARLSLTSSRSLFYCWPSSRSLWALSPPKNQGLGYRDCRELFKGGSIHPPHHDWLVCNGLPPLSHPHWSIFSSWLSNSHPDRCPCHRGYPFIWHSTLRLHWPGLICLPLLKSLCQSITALHPLNVPIVPQLLHQRWSSVTAHAALVPPVWTIRSPAARFLLQSTLQLTTHDTGFHYNSLIKASEFVVVW